MTYVAAVVLYLWLFWGLYVLVMGIYRAHLAKRLTLVTTVLSFPFIVAGYAMDIVAQYTIATVFFFDLPQWREHLVTASYITAALFKNSDANALAVGTHYAGNGEYAQTVFTFFMQAGTTSLTTFRVRAGQHVGGTLTFNGGGGARRLAGILFSSITITKIKA